MNEHAHIEALDGVLEGLHAGRQEMEGEAAGEGWPPAPDGLPTAAAVTGWWSSSGLGLSVQLDLAVGGGGGGRGGAGADGEVEPIRLGLEAAGLGV